jgi:hypothetical protein
VSLFSFLKSLFGNKSGSSSGASSWMGEQTRRTSQFERDNGSWVVNKIKAHNGLAFSWESGGDEAFVTFADFSADDEDKFQLMEEYIVNKLDIPDAGEFNMTGQGNMYIEDKFVKAKYSSVIKEVVDFNEETETEVYGEEEEDSGDRKLFEIR